MNKLSDTSSNRSIIQNYIDELKRLISAGESFRYSGRSRTNLADLNIDYGISETHLYNAVLSLKVTDYSRGLDVSNQGDCNLCVFDVTIKGVNIYLKTGIGIKFTGIIIMSCHEPLGPINKPFN